MRDNERIKNIFDLFFIHESADPFHFVDNLVVPYPFYNLSITVGCVNIKRKVSEEAEILFLWEFSFWFAFQTTLSDCHKSHISQQIIDFFPSSKNSNKVSHSKHWIREIQSFHEKNHLTKGMRGKGSQQKTWKSFFVWYFNEAKIAWSTGKFIHWQCKYTSMLSSKPSVWTPTLRRVQKILKSVWLWLLFL